MKFKYQILAAAAAVTSVSCNGVLDISPESSIPEQSYLTAESHLDTYALDRYPELFNHKGCEGNNSLLLSDNGTDDKTSVDAEAIELFSAGGAGVSVESSAGLWNFTKIRKCNYFFERVLDAAAAGKISGSPTTINHYIGEMYFFRAYEYFKLYSELGDFPIITEVLPLEGDALIEASKRSPRSEVARFILSDLDEAIKLMMEVSPDGRKNRLNKNIAHLFKARVALFEGSWLTYFNGTAFVPNGMGWTGAKMYPDYQYKAGSIEAEARWFLEQAQNEAEIVADAVPLTPMNATKTLQQDASEPENPYFDMFGADDMSSYSEIMAWRDFDRALGVVNGVANSVNYGNYRYGTTKGLVDSYLMRNGLPIYAANSGYAGYDTTFDVVEDRDARLQLFLKLPGQKNFLTGTSVYPQTEGYPIIGGVNGYSTGYAMRKYGPKDGYQFVAASSDVGSHLFRSSEALLIYMEASYMLTGSVNGKAAGYWSQLRSRAGVDTDYTKTVAATDMNKEAEGDWGAYSAGKLVDPTLYNIRRERRNELMSEGFRMNDIRRWRSMDQLMANPYIIQGFKLWNSTMNEWYTEGYTYADGTKSDPVDLKVRGEDGAFLSPAEDGDYLCPLRIIATHANFDGYTWQMPHYLTPIAAHHFTMVGGDESVIYQNPGWDILGGSNAGTL